MSTTISDFREPLRHLLGDRDPSVFQYSDANLDVAIKTMIRMGKLDGFTLDQTQTAIAPSIANPNNYALLLYETVKSFVDANPDAYAYRTRAMGERFGAWRDFLFALETNIHRLRNGVMFDGWQSLQGWLESLTGDRVAWASLTRMEIQAPVSTVTLTRAGPQLG